MRRQWSHYWTSWSGLLSRHSLHPALSLRGCVIFLSWNKLCRLEAHTPTLPAPTQSIHKWIESRVAIQGGWRQAPRWLWLQWSGITRLRMRKHWRLEERKKHSRIRFQASEPWDWTRHCLSREASKDQREEREGGLPRQQAYEGYGGWWQREDGSRRATGKPKEEAQWESEPSTLSRSKHTERDGLCVGRREQ